MKSAVLIALLAAIFSFSVASAHANLLYFNFFLEEPTGNPVYTGTLSIDQALVTIPNTFVSFSEIESATMPGSLNIEVGNSSWHLADALDPTNEGIFTGSSPGTIQSFHDVTSDSLIIFLNTQGLFIEENNQKWSANQFSANNIEGAAHGFARAEVPLPATLPLLATAIIGMFGVAHHRKRQ